MTGKKQTFDQYRINAERYLETNYCITLSDAGINDDYIRSAFEDGEPEMEFIENFASKYNLDPKNPFGKMSHS